MIETWNYQGDSSRANGRILAAAALAARGTRCRVAPFRDDVLRRLGVWVQGEPAEVGKVLEVTDKALREKKVKFHRLRWQGTRERA